MDQKNTSEHEEEEMDSRNTFERVGFAAVLLSGLAVLVLAAWFFPIRQFSSVPVGRLVSVSVIAQASDSSLFGVAVGGFMVGLPGNGAGHDSLVRTDKASYLVRGVFLANVGQTLDLRKYGGLWQPQRLCVSGSSQCWDLADSRN